jgi:hypothetical protein
MGEPEEGLGRQTCGGLLGVDWAEPLATGMPTSFLPKNLGSQDQIDLFQ